MGSNNSGRNVNDYQCILFLGEGGLTQIFLLPEPMEEDTVFNEHYVRKTLGTTGLDVLQGLVPFLWIHEPAELHRTQPASEDSRHLLLMPVITLVLDHWPGSSKTPLPSRVPPFRASHFVNHPCRVCCHTFPFPMRTIL